MVVVAVFRRIFLQHTKGQTEITNNQVWNASSVKRSSWTLILFRSNRLFSVNVGACAYSCVNWHRWNLIRDWFEFDFPSRSKGTRSESHFVVWCSVENNKKYSFQMRSLSNKCDSRRDNTIKKLSIPIHWIVSMNHVNNLIWTYRR